MIAAITTSKHRKTSLSATLGSTRVIANRFLKWATVGAVKLHSKTSESPSQEDKIRFNAYLPEYQNFLILGSIYETLGKYSVYLQGGAKHSRDRETQQSGREMSKPSSTAGEFHTQAKRNYTFHQTNSERGR